tara:strand:- start:260 stop:529 length:270 start_codon:yes stop_codon:yes gene_type:complete
MTEAAKLVSSYSSFDDPVNDKLLGIVISLTSEVWSLTHRLHLIEEILQENLSSLDLQKEIENKTHDDQLQNDCDKKLEEFVTRVMRGLD